MKAPFDFIVEPKGDRYNNVKKVDGKDLIVNTEIFNHQFINREAIVKSIPTAFKTEIKPGDTVIVHHNVFRRWHNVKGEEKNSRSYFDENTYFVKEDQIFLYKRNQKWLSPKKYCFVQPIKDKNNITGEKLNNVERPLIGKIVYTNSEFKKGDLVGFTPFSKYEFIIEGKRLYRIMTQFITIKYEYQGDEEEYNPSWAKSS